MARTVRKARKTSTRKTRRPTRKPRARRSAKVSRNRRRKSARKSPRARKVVFAAVWAKLGRELIRLLKKERGLDRKAIATALAGDVEIRKLLVERVALVAGIQPQGEARAYVLPVAAAPVLPEDDEAANEYAMASSYAKARAAKQQEQTTDESADWRLF